MSEIKLITPLLEGHLMGDPISNHHGVRCCPAIQKDTDKKYIVKVLSIPASAVQLEALLLSGAFADKESALAYFKELADGVAAEAEVLRKLSSIEGFCSYEDWQIVPMEDGTGYDVYLLGTYQPTLDRFFRSNGMTHLAAVNLGLDLCAALSVCRRNGYLYIALKPGNIFITPNREYRIGDLGFLHLDSLKYASMPERYRSAYTAPEITDAYAALNSTLDVFSVGMILYQAYNNNQLPDLSQFPAQPLTPPMYADYEMAQIILKACAIDPADRWEDPAQMGHELVSYMQRNNVNDVPIVPPAEPIEDETVVEAEEPAEEPVTEAVADEEAVQEVEAAQEEAEEEPAQETQDDVSDTASDEVPEEHPVEEVPDVDEPDHAPSEEESDEVPSESPEEDIDFAEAEPQDDTVPSEEILPELEDAEVTDEVSAMLAQADELIAHKTPDPVIQPEPIDVPIPEPIVLVAEEDEQTEPEAEVPEAEAADEAPDEPVADDAQTEEPAETDEVADEAPCEEVDVPQNAAAKKRLGGLVTGLVAALILLLLAAGAFFYYNNYYLQRVDGINVSGEGNSLTVTLNTQVSSDLLTVYCTDTYGNKLQAAVVDNVATFTQLNPGTNYKIQVDISGFHRLVGTTTANYTTDAQVTVLTFTAMTGDQDGSVVLNFSVQGQDNTAWRVHYSAEGESEKFVDCSGHMANITGLTVGSVYTFRLVPVNDLYVIGEHTLEYTATKVIYPQNLQNHGYSNGALHITWNAPEGISVGSWIIRCYNNSGYDTTFTVTEPAAAIEGLDPAEGYTVDVKAEGMSVSQWISISANSITFTDILLDDSNAGELVITWICEGVIPTDGWRLFYTIDGGEKYVIQSDTNTCTISPLLPGATYDITFDLPADYAVIGGTAQYIVPSAEMFDSYGVTWEDFSFRMCYTPNNADWRWYDLYETDFTDTVSADDKVSFVLALDGRYTDSDDEIRTLFVVRDAQGDIVSITPGRTREWGDMWTKFNGTTGTEFDLPALPQTEGEYTVDIYFNNALLTTQAFTVE